MLKFIIIGNPGNRRIDLFQRALTDNGLSPAAVIPYKSLLDDGLSFLDSADEDTIIRIESPGEDFEVEKRLIALGARSTGDTSPIDPEEAMGLQEEYGRICHPGLWYSGFRSLLMDISSYQSYSRDHKGFFCRWMNNPEEIAVMFDKSVTSKLLGDNDIAVPSQFPPVSNYDELINFAVDCDSTRLFVKLRYSSSASGIMTFEYNKRLGRANCYSTIEFMKEKGISKFYNSLKVKQYTDHKKIEDIINFLCSEGIHIEKWIPKSKYNSCSYDIRVVVINKKSCHTVVRLSNSPLTNLHLGNKRTSIESLNLTNEILDAIYGNAEKVMGLFPDSFYSGIDILIPSGSIAPVVLEVNAFGDLLPGNFYEGIDTYSTEIMSYL